MERLAQGIDFELFRSFLENTLEQKAKSRGGRPPYDYVLMFKILILQRFYNLSDNQVEYPINDRLSFMRFLDLTIADDVPDSKTVWNLKEQLVDLELVEPIFNLFLTQLENLGLVVNEGKIIDASFVEVPKQRNSKEDNELIKEGVIPEKFNDNPHKLAQKDTDARWVQKGNVNYFGYKNHIKTDAKSKIITKYVVTDASVHDSQVLDNLLDSNDEGENFYADSAYTGEKQDVLIETKEVINQVCQRAYRNTPLTEEQKYKKQN